MIDKTLDNEEKRSIVVNLIGALDYYIHEIIIWGLVQITLNKFPKGKKYNKIYIPIEYLKMIIEDKIEFDDTKIKRKIIEDIRINSYQTMIIRNQMKKYKNEKKDFRDFYNKIPKVLYFSLKWIDKNQFFISLCITPISSSFSFFQNFLT
ncbi:MAG TPA: hypothetical protein VIG61_05405 [Fusobacterium sp.]|uniref:hypothetical protein n=1 Tax=Fusobacterium sp. TaxID=68766 RepID=UPI002F3F6359